MDSLGLKCQRCSEAASAHVTEMTDGVPRESHFCEAHAREAGVAAPIRWDDDSYARVEVTARQLERPKLVAVRFPDGYETDLGDVWDVFTGGHQRMFARSPDGSEIHVLNLVDLLDDAKPTILVIPQKGAGGPRHVRIDLVPETPKEGS